MTAGRPSGLTRARRVELYREAQRALALINPHVGDLPLCRRPMVGWTRYGLAWHRMDFLAAIATLYRLDLEDTRARIDDAARAYSEAAYRLHCRALADPSTAEVVTAPLPLRGPRAPHGGLVPPLTPGRVS